MAAILSGKIRPKTRKAELDIVNGVLLRDGAVLLARRAAHRKTHPGRWSFPGGHLERGESLEEALARELVEEIGVAPVAFRKIDTAAVPKKARLYHLFAVTAWTGGEPRLIGDEHSEMRWIDLAAAADLDGLALPAYRTLLRRLAQSSGVAGTIVGPASPVRVPTSAL